MDGGKNRPPDQTPNKQVSISPTFYKQLFHTKEFRTTFNYLHSLGFAIFLQKEMDVKAICKILMIFTPGLELNRFHASGKLLVIILKEKLR